MRRVNEQIGTTDIYYKVGYQCLGPLLVGFSQWLHEKTKDVDKLLFFARDGYIMQKAYHMLYPNESSSYVYISRRSVTVPQLVSAQNWKDVISIIGYIKREETWEMLLHKMGIEDCTLCQSLVDKYGSKVLKNDLLHDSRFSEAFDLVKPLMMQNAHAEMIEAKKYLNPYFNGRVGIVDIGWYGTMQQVLNRLYSSDVEINGYYIGLLKREGYSPDNMQGFIFDYLHSSAFDDKLIYGFNGLIESFFSADHGSTKKYIDGKPILEEWESQNWPLISKVHEGALQFCQDSKAFVEQRRFGKQVAFSALWRFLTKPTKEEIESFGKIVFFDTYYEPLVKYSGGGQITSCILKE